MYMLLLSKIITKDILSFPLVSLVIHFFIFCSIFVFRLEIFVPSVFYLGFSWISGGDGGERVN